MTEDKGKNEENKEENPLCPRCGKRMEKKTTFTGKAFYQCEDCMVQIQPDYYKTRKSCTQNRPFDFGFV